MAQKMRDGLIAETIAWMINGGTESTLNFLNPLNFLDLLNFSTFLRTVMSRTYVK